MAVPHEARIPSAAMQFPLEDVYRSERADFVATIESLDDDDFDHGETLCEGWAPRDVLAHLMGIDTMADAYVRAGGIGRGNARVVAAYRGRTRSEITERAHRWAAEPALTTRIASAFFLGDLCVHHQDILRPRGRGRDLDPQASAAILREGVVLGARRLLSHRVVPTDGGRPLGRGTPVTGTREALGMWLTGRRGIEADLEFG